MKQTKEFWQKRLSGNEPQRVQNAIKRIYAAYPENCLPDGLCDPMYIMNVICKELGVGDGKGKFTLPPEKSTLINALQRTKLLWGKIARQYKNNQHCICNEAATIINEALSTGA